MRREGFESMAEVEAALAVYFRPGRVVPTWDGGLDRVLAFRPTTDEAPWEVEVVGVNVWGAQTGPVRTHTTMPPGAELARVLRLEGLHAEADQAEMLWGGERAQSSYRGAP